MKRLFRLTPTLLIAALLALPLGRAATAQEAPAAPAETPAENTAAPGEEIPLPRPNPERLPPEETAPPGEAGPALTEPLNFLPNGAAVLDPNAQPLDLLPAPANPDGTPPAPQEFILTALLTEGGQPIPDGLDWRVFAPEPGPDGTLPLVAEATGGIARVNLEPGQYYLHAAYGRAGATARIMVEPGNVGQTVVLNAGGLRLDAVVGDDVPIPPTDLRFEVWVDADDGDRALVQDNVPPGEILRLNAGAYHVVSYYGNTNAIVRADIRVDAGQLTDVTLYHQAARLTLKLVTIRGGEALANTAWSVVSAGGEIVFDSVGAFPTVVLSAGDYTAIARHNDQIFESPFTVVSAVNRDVEVLAQNPIAPDAAVGAPAIASDGDPGAAAVAPEAGGLRP